MKKWEYLYICIPVNDLDGCEGYFNKLGNDGWEIVAITFSSVPMFTKPPRLMAIAKREKEDKRGQE